MSQKSDAESAGEGDFVPLSFDPTPSLHSSPQPLQPHRSPRIDGRDYFGNARTQGKSAHRPSDSTSASPHIAYQDRGRVPSEEGADSTLHRKVPDPRAATSTTASPLIGRKDRVASPESTSKTDSVTSDDKFKLQEAPKTKKSAHSARSSRSGPLASLSNLVSGIGSNQSSDRSNVIVGVDSPSVGGEPDKPTGRPTGAARHPSNQQSKEDTTADQTKSPPLAIPLAQLAHPPKRGDSLESSKARQSISRKEAPSTFSKGSDSPQTAPGTMSLAPTTPPSSAGKMSGGKISSWLTESPRSRGMSDSSLHKLSEAATANTNGSLTASEMPSRAVRSYDTGQDGTRAPTSPGLPRWSAGGGDFSLDEDMDRILGGEDPQMTDSFLRRVSNSVRHIRSFSDKGTRSSKDGKWPRSPTGPADLATTAHTRRGSQDLSSPTAATPERRDELSWVKTELRRERQKMAEREQRISELESTLLSQANIKQANSELRQKRSTIVNLDTQKEMAVRELEILSEHIASAKQSGGRLDLTKMRHAVTRDFAESLQKLKDSFAPQLEDLVEKRNELIEEVSNLTQLKDKNFQEFEQLSIKNAQLAEFNNDLVHQIQQLYQATQAGQQHEQTQGTPDGLGIYSHHPQKSHVSTDSREIKVPAGDVSTPGLSTAEHQEEAEPATVLQGPQVVNIRKGQAKKFNWKKAQTRAKVVTTGIKEVFSSTPANYGREMQFSETTPYGSPPPTHEHPINGSRNGNVDPVAANFRLFGGGSSNISGPKHATSKGQQASKSQSNGHSSAPPVDATTCK